MPKPKTRPMSIQPSEQGSTVPTQSLPRMPSAEPKSGPARPNKRKPDEEAVRIARAREGIRLDALKKQRKAMKR
jgi:hypothetical protein